MALSNPVAPLEFQGSGGYYDVTNSLGLTRDDINKFPEIWGQPKFNVDALIGVVETAELLSRAYSGSCVPTKKFIHGRLLGALGWWVKLAPWRRMDRMQNIEIDTYYRGKLDLAPEDIAPKFMTHRSEAHTETLVRYNKGARFRVDFFKTTAGQVVLDNTLVYIADATFVKVRELTISSILNSKQYYREFNDVNRSGFAGPLESTARERRTFGILSKDPQGIYKLFNSAREVMKTEGVNATMVVIPQGVGSLLAFSKFESTDASVRGPIINERLTQGGASILRQFDGFAVYEDSGWDSTLEEREILYKRTTLGQFFMVDKSKIQECVDECTSELNLLSLKIPSVPDDAMVQIGYKTLIDNMMKYDDNGDPHPHLQFVIDNLDQLQDILKLKVQNQLVDPFIFWADTPTGGVYKVIEYYGDTQLPYFTIQQNIDFGKRVRRQMDLDKVMTSAMQESLRELKSLKDILSNPDDILSPSFQGYWFAIEANPENRVNFETNPSFYLRPNYYGSEQPPFVEQTPSGQEGPGSRMYVMDPRLPAVKLYVYAIRSTVTNEIVAFILAPFLTGTNEEKLTQLAVYGADIIKDQESVPELVPAPNRPYGYGEITGLRTLAQLFNNSDGRGWDKDILKEAHDGIQALDTYFSWLHSLFPSNAFFDSKYLPTHLKSGKVEDDIRNSAITHLFGEQKFPVMVKISKPLGPVGAIRRVNLYSSGLEDTQRPVFSDQKTEEILKNMGFRFVSAQNDAVEEETADQSVIDEEAKGNIYLTRQQLDVEKATLQSILNSGQLNDEVKNALLENGGSTLFDSYASPKNNLGKTYSGFLAKTSGKSGNYQKFAYLWQKNISSVTNPLLETDSAAKVFDNILLTSKYPGNVKGLSQGYIDTLKSGPSTDSKRKLQSEGISRRKELEDTRIAIPEGVSEESENYINSRLVLDRSVFQKLARRIGNDSTALTQAFLSIIRPSDPNDATKALAAYGTGAYPTVEDLANLKKVYSQYEYAALKFKSRGAGAFEYPGLFKGRYDDYKELNEYDNRDLNTQFYGGRGPLTVEVNSFDDTNVVCPPAEEANEIVSRTNVIRRLQAINDTVQDYLVSIPAKLFVLSRVKKDTLFNWVDHGLPPPTRSIIIAEPWIRFDMGVAIAAVPGIETAETGYNHEDTILQLDGMIKDWTLHFSIYLGVFIYDPRNIMILHDAVFGRYVSGYDTTFYNKRDMFDPIIVGGKASLIAIDCGGNFKREELGGYLSITGKNDDRQIIYPLNQKVYRSQMQQYPSAFFYGSFWHFNEMNQTTSRDISSFITEKRSNYENTICFSGSQLNYNLQKKDFKDLYIGNGHVGMYFFFILFLILFIQLLYYHRFKQSFQEKKWMVMKIKREQPLQIKKIKIYYSNQSDHFCCYIHCCVKKKAF
jgi:hypothetical protein